MADMIEPIRGTARRYGNRYTKFKDEKRRLGRHSEVMYQRRRYSKLKVQMILEEFGEEEGWRRILEHDTPFMIQEMPKAKQKKRTKTRSDKGGTHRKPNDSRRKSFEKDKYTLLDQTRDLKKTLQEIAYWEAWEQMQADRLRPEKLALRKATLAKDQRIATKKMESRQRYLNGGITNRTKKRHQERESKLPVDRVCPICGLRKELTKQWILLMFADGEFAICRSDYENIRTMYFGGDVVRCREFFKCCRYADLKVGLQNMST